VFDFFLVDIIQVLPADAEGKGKNQQAGESFHGKKPTQVIAGTALARAWL